MSSPPEWDFGALCPVCEAVKIKHYGQGERGVRYASPWIGERGDSRYTKVLGNAQSSGRLRNSVTDS
jgi:hypothetical protein